MTVIHKSPIQNSLIWAQLACIMVLSAMLKINWEMGGFIVNSDNFNNRDRSCICPPWVYDEQVH